MADILFILESVEENWRDYGHSLSHPLGFPYKKINIENRISKEVWAAQ